MGHRLCGGQPAGRLHENIRVPRLDQSDFKVLDRLCESGGEFNSQGLERGRQRATESESALYSFMCRRTFLIIFYHSTRDYCCIRATNRDRDIPVIGNRVYTLFSAQPIDRLFAFSVRFECESFLRLAQKRRENTRQYHGQLTIRRGKGAELLMQAERGPLKHCVRDFRNGRMRRDNEITTKYYTEMNTATYLLDLNFKVYATIIYLLKHNKSTTTPN